MAGNSIYNANLFRLIRAEDLPIAVYQPSVSPSPKLRPQLYQILGRLANKLTRDLGTVVVSDERMIKALAATLPSSAESHKVDLENVGTFRVDLTLTNEDIASPRSFGEYKRFVNKIVDTAVLHLSPEYYKFHPDAPYILKDDPFFDEELIGLTGIIDAKRYYRSLKTFRGNPYMLFNRGIQLRSFKNLLNEMQCLASRHGKRKGEDIDFYEPPKSFVKEVNYLLRNKTAHVIRYPGPRIRRIQSVTWEYRAGDRPPGADMSPAEYLAKNYGVIGLDKSQPLVSYRLETSEGEVTRHHVPEVLAVSHHLEDLEKRIPKWQRPQVWDRIQPDCKNQMREICNQMKQIDGILRESMPELYPSLLELSIEPQTITQWVTGPLEIELTFSKKNLTVVPPYDDCFYKRYSKAIKFAHPVEDDVSALVHVDEMKSSHSSFFELMEKEFSRHNNGRLLLHNENLDFETENYKDYDLVFTVSDSNDLYQKAKELIQNSHGILHQNVRPENVEKHSVMAIVMQLSLMLGGYPWLLRTEEKASLFTLHSYLHPASDSRTYFFNVLRTTGEVEYQSPPYPGDGMQRLLKDIGDKISKRKRTVLLTSHLLEEDCQDMLRTINDLDDVDILWLVVVDGDELRIFRSWKPSHIPPRRIRRVVRVTEDQLIEAYQEAPQGVLLDDGNQRFYLVTGRSIRRKTLVRGCPTAMRVDVAYSRGNFDNMKATELVLAHCFMSRMSGHMTRVPSSLYYLRRLAGYVHNYGFPENEMLHQKLFYL